MSRGSLVVGYALLAALLWLSGCAVPVNLPSASPAPPSAAAASPPPAAPASPAPVAPTLAAPAPTPDSTPGIDWTVVTDPATGINVRMAGPAKHDTKETKSANGPIHFDVYATTFNTFNAQQLFVSDVPRALTSGQLSSLFADQAQKQSGKLVHSNPVTVNGHQGVDAELMIVDQGQAARLYVRAACTDNKMVQLITEGLEGDQAAQLVHKKSADTLTLP